MAGGFLNRWSRRKAGEQMEPEQKPVDATLQAEAIKPATLTDPLKDQALPVSATLEDVEKIDRFAPDFSAFMKPGVDPAVQQAALKKMFSDPHFNVMDGLDIYIDDYSKPEPLPFDMLKRMVQSDMLNIFRKGDGNAEEQEKLETATSSESEEVERALPLSNPVDLTSTHSSTESEISSDSIHAHKNNS